VSCPRICWRIERAIMIFLSISRTYFEDVNAIFWFFLVFEVKIISACLFTFLDCCVCSLPTFLHRDFRASVCLALSLLFLIIYIIVQRIYLWWRISWPRRWNVMLCNVSTWVHFLGWKFPYVFRFYIIGKVGGIVGSIYVERVH